MLSVPVFDETREMPRGRLTAAIVSESKATSWVGNGVTRRRGECSTSSLLWPRRCTA